MKIIKQNKIKAIYEKIADKTLNIGCKFNHDGIEFIHSGNTNADEVILESVKEGIAYIIGHPVMIGDILDYYEIEKGYNPESIDNDWDISTGYAYIYIDWKDKRKPIEFQSDNCIDLVYNIIK